jgi:hypothetical protein
MRRRWQEHYQPGQPVLVMRNGTWIPGRVTRAGVPGARGVRGYVIVAVATERGDKVGIYACTREKDITTTSVAELCLRCLTRPRVGDGSCGSPLCSAEDRRIRERMRQAGIIEEDP